jgi:hypothetical protein
MGILVCLAMWVISGPKGSILPTSVSLTCLIIGMAMEGKSMGTLGQKKKELKGVAWGWIQQDYSDALVSLVRVRENFNRVMIRQHNILERTLYSFVYISSFPALPL